MATDSKDIVKIVEHLSEHAKSILYFCSFLDFGAIPNCLLARFVERKNIKHFLIILNKLGKFSLLIRCDDAAANPNALYRLDGTEASSTVLHKLHERIPAILQEPILNKETQKQLLLDAIHIICAEYLKKESNSEENKEDIALIPHMESILSHCGRLFSDSTKMVRDSLQLPLLLRLANAYGNIHNDERKKSCLEQTLLILESLCGKKHWAVAKTLVNLATVNGNLYSQKRELNDVGTQAEAKRDLLERALPILEQHQGINSRQVATVLVHLAVINSILGDLDRAKALLERALSILEEHYGPAHPEVAIALNNLAGVKLFLNESALEELERAYKIFLGKFGEINPSTQSIKSKIEKYYPHQLTSLATIRATFYGHPLIEPPIKKCKLADEIEPAETATTRENNRPSLGNSR